MPFGTFAPSSRKRSGSRQEVDDLLQLGLGLVGAGDLVPLDRAPSESGLISCGLVFGISFIVRQRKKTISPMKRIGPHEAG